MKKKKEDINLSNVNLSNRLSSIAVVASTEVQTRSLYKHYFHPFGRYVIPISPYGWYRVLVYIHKSGITIEKALDKMSMAVAPQKLRYHYFHEGGDEDDDQDKRASFTFYVDSYKLAVELQQRGHQPPVIGVRVSDGPPNIQVDDFYRWKVRKVIMSRYDSEKHCLNLSRFYADNNWKGDFCALQQFECLEVIIDIMEQEMPQLLSLQLDNNHLFLLVGFIGVERRLPQLKNISLQHNELKSLRELSVFEHLQLIELNLRKNPLPLNYEQLLIIKFPHLRKLNGQPLSSSRSSSSNEVIVNDSEIGSDVEIVPISEYKPFVIWPETRALYLVSHDPNIQPGIRKFVRQYLKAFDGGKRSMDLECFYHDNTLVSLTLAKDQPSWSRPYSGFDRQLLASRPVVLKMFESWPKTRHLPSTMTLDLTMVQLKMLSVAITGSFEEFGTSEQRRHYMRTFVLTRSMETDDFRISNELIYLGRDSHGRGQRQPLNTIQQNLMTKLSAETRLKARWSCKFLRDTNWDYQQSMLAFRTLLRSHQIPKKAFDKG